MNSFPGSNSRCWIAFGVGWGLTGIALGADPIEFNRDIRPILANNCTLCHGPDAKKREADLRLDVRENATAAHDGHRAIAPHDPKASELVRRITAADPDERMPPPASGKKLTPRQIELLTRWISEGAVYQPHWSYIKPVRPPLPAVADKSWPKNAIDRFILARLTREGLHPSSEAGRETLVRRLSLDLTGLPPTIDEIDRFVKDERPDAYGRLVDRLMASDAYGEHWARMWLDLARYADSAGYVSDIPREIWPFRDYVIRSFNSNKPFDQFTIEQIAGDLLPSPTDEQLTASAFHRNTQTNNEGGSDREEYRNVAIVDRVNTTMAVWMGTTMACAQCHDHKYDPISQKEYFRFFAILNNTEDADRADEHPIHSLFTDAQTKKRKQLEAAIAVLDKGIDSKSKDSKVGSEKKHEKGETPEKEGLSESEKKLKKLKADLAAIKPAGTVPIMQELKPGQRRITAIEYRGNFLDRGPEVTPGVPEAFPPMRKGVACDRLALAHWLVSEDNPLVARVVVNRYWEKLFGVGIVATCEDFGTQGELPSNPELLDWLATELMTSHWDLKHIVRLMVTSAAYRQSSATQPELTERDPDNRLLARGPRFRLDAEVIRDQALFVSGLLSRKMYGPAVRPLQPSFGLSAAFGGGMDWTTSEGEDRYRRAIYTSWRRTNPYPSMSTFDSPSREVCTVRRSRTNTPLQALVTLNDPVYVEMAQALARRIAKEGGPSPDEKVRYAFRLCLARYPSDAEAARVAELHQAALARFGKEPEQARKMATVPLGDPPRGADLGELAAWTVVGNVLLNLDEMFMRP